MITQVLSLQPGWNAVYLRVDPTNDNPAKVFANTPVTKVATYFSPVTPVEYLQDPAEIPWKQSGWSVWFAPQLPESAASDLFAVLGAQPYLIYSSSSATVSVTGPVHYRRIRWRAGSFNFVGLPVNPANPPTFTAFFTGSAAHLSTNRASVYTLNSGHWQPVTLASSTIIQPDTAYWVFCDGGSDYQSPVDVGVQSSPKSGRIDFGGTAETLSLKLLNNTSSPRAVVLELSPTNTLPTTYYQLVSGTGTQIQVPLMGPQNFTLDSGAELDLRLTLDRAAMPQAVGSAILTAKDDLGTLIALPVVGQQSP